MKRNVMRQELTAFTERFIQESGLKIAFDDEAYEHLIDVAVDLDKTIRAVCEERFKDLEYGLKIIARNTGAESFTISRKMAENPDAELSRMVVESFQHQKETELESPSESKDH
jgi:hypothetical protein